MHLTFCTRVMEILRKTLDYSISNIKIFVIVSYLVPARDTEIMIRTSVKLGRYGWTFIT